MIIKYSRDGAELARFATEEEAAKDGKFTLPLLRSHLNAKKPKYLDGCVYKVEAAVLPIEAPGSGNELRFQRPAEKGKTALSEDALNAKIEFTETGSGAYEGGRLRGVTIDEGGLFADLPVIQLEPGDVSPDAGFSEALNIAGEKSKDVRRETMQDLFDMNLAITKTVENGEVARIDLLSEEGQQVLDLRDAASRALNPSDPIGSIPDDFHLTPMEKRRREQNATRLRK